MKTAAVTRNEAQREFHEVMNLNQLAAYLQLSPQTLYRKVECGEIPGAKIGRQWRFKKAVIDEWLERTALFSPAGLDLLMRETKEAADRAGYRPEEVDRLIEKVRAEAGR
jgi:excisionase family DNA binding protein